MPSPLTLHVARDGKTIGQFPIDTAQQCLDEGIILPTDHCWHEGMTEWKPVSEVVVKKSLPPLPPPVAPPPLSNHPLPATPNSSVGKKTTLAQKIAIGVGVVCLSCCFNCSDFFDSSSTYEEISAPADSISDVEPVSTPDPSSSVTQCNKFQLIIDQTQTGIVLKLDTDLPDDIPIGITVRRGYFQDGTGLLAGTVNEEYAIDYFNIMRKPLGEWRQGFVIELNDQKWIADLRAKALELKFGVRQVRTHVDIRAIVNIPDTKKFNIQGDAMKLSEFGDKMLESEIRIERPLKAF